MVCLSHQSIRKLLPFQESEGIPLKKDILVQQLVNSFGNWVRTDCENRAGGTARMTRDLYPYTSLFSPIRINKLTVKNRLVMAPMGNCQMAEETGRPNDKMLQYFFARAEGGVGLLTTGLFAGYCVLRCMITPSMGPRQPTATWKERITCLPAAIPVIITFATVIGGIYAGLATPTEAAALGCVAVIIIAACMRKLTRTTISLAFRDGAKMSASIFFLFIGGWLMSRFLVTTGTTRHMVDLFVGFHMSRETLLFMMFFLLLVLGCILESTSILVLTMPFMYPITQSYGIDPIWFGTFVTMMMVLAGISPPVGLNVFVVRSVCTHIPVIEIYKGAMPFIVIMVISVLAICVFPDLVLAPVRSMMI